MLTKGSICDAMLEHPIQHVISKNERKGIETCIYLLKYQESQTHMNMISPIRKLEAKKMKRTRVIYTGENLCFIILAK